MMRIQAAAVQHSAFVVIFKIWCSAELSTGEDRREAQERRAAPHIEDVVVVLLCERAHDPFLDAHEHAVVEPARQATHEHEVIIHQRAVVREHEQRVADYDHAWRGIAEH